VLLLLALSAPARADQAFVTAQSADAVSVVDLAAMKTVATLPIGGKPAGVAVSRDGARVYVTSPDGQFITVIDARARTALKKIPLKGAPLGIAVSLDGKRVYATLAYDRLLVEIDPERGVTRELGVGAMASGVAVTPDGKTLLVADRDDNALSVIDAGTLTRVAVIPVGRHPFGVTIDAAGARAYAANVESDDVSVIDLAGRKVVGTLKTGSRPYTVALAAGRIFVADQHADEVSVFDAASRARGRGQGGGISRGRRRKPRWRAGLRRQLVFQRAMGHRRQNPANHRQGRDRRRSARFRLLRHEMTLAPLLR